MPATRERARRAHARKPLARKIHARIENQSESSDEQRGDSRRHVLLSPREQPVPEQEERTAEDECRAPLSPAEPLVIAAAQ